ncbi:hypothetical protein ACLB2K_043062 [Fragaria x ananassa]
MAMVLSQQLDHHQSSAAGIHSLPAVPLSLAAIQEFGEDCYLNSDSDDEGSLFSIDFNCINHKNMKQDQIVQEEKVYHVAVDLMKSETSMDALLWTLSQAVAHPSSHIKTLYHVKLVHVFPPVHFIPSPLGMLPRSKVSPKMVKNYLAQERDRRTKLLEKYVAACSTAKVKVDVMFIENGTTAKTILDLISTGNVKILVVATTKSSLRKLRSRKGTGVANQILRNASPETSCCDIKIICKGKELVIDQIIGSPSSRSSNANSISKQEDQDQDRSSSVI